MSTHYLYFNGKTLADIEVSKEDLHVVICIEVYSDFLLQNVELKDKIISDFYKLQELRGEYFERVLHVITPKELVSNYLKYLANKYELGYITD